MSTCRSCGAEVLWAQSERGRAIPLDPEPSSRGTLVLEFGAERAPFDGILEHVPRVAVRARPGERLGQPRYVNHTVSCPKAPAWRGVEGPMGP